MKKILKTTLSFTLAGILAFFSNASVFAAEVIPNNENVSIEVSTDAIVESGASTFSNYYYSGNVTTSWKTIARSTTGFGCNVYVDCTNLNLAKHDIRMLGANGNEIWSEKGAIAPIAKRIFICGSDVYEIQLRTQSGTSVVYVGPTSEPAN